MVRDGNSNNIGITSMDEEVINYFDTHMISQELEKKIYPKKNSKASTIIYSSKEKTKGKNKVLNSSKDYKLINNKHIPNEFKINDRNNRLQLLAGLIDSDGYYNKNCNQYEMTLKSEKLINDILFLRSLGYSATKKETQKKCYNNDTIGTYYRIIFYGHTPDIPVKLTRKQARDRVINKDLQDMDLKLKIDEADFYGFNLNGDHQYLAEDFIVHHNCGGNGKSKLIELFELAFGDYCKDACSH